MKRRVILYMLTLLLGAAPVWAQDQFQRREPGTPFYNVEVSRFPTRNPDSSRVVIYLKVLYDDLQFVKYDTTYQAKYEISVVAFDVDDIQVDSDIDRRTVQVKSFEATNSRDLNDYARYAFTLDNAQYKFTVGLMDLDTRKTTYRKFTVDLKKFIQGNLQLSDLVIVDNILHPDSGNLVYDPNVIDKLTDRSKNYYLYYMARGNPGTAIVDGAVLTTEGKELRTHRDTITVDSIPGGHFISMDTKGLNYSKYVYRMNLTQGDTTVERRKEFQVGWAGLSNQVTNLDNAIDQMVYVLSNKEINRMKKADPEDKRKMFSDYWKQRDPSPGTEENELMDEYYRRVNLATEQFSTSIREGWRTDRGMVYVLFGAPNDIDRHPFELGSKPYQIWYYFDLNRQFVFVDETGFDDYRLVTPLHEY